MAVLWKKAKFAGLLADLRSRRRRRSSLVIQTGFPTSVADLFLKNSFRLKSPSSFHTKPRHDSLPPFFPSEPPLADPPQTHRPDIPRSGSGDLAGAQPSAPKRLPCLIKLFFILILALGTKQIAVAITASALLLFLFEFLGKRSQSRPDQPRPHPQPNHSISSSSEIRASSSYDDEDEIESRRSSNSSFGGAERSRVTSRDDVNEVQSHAHEKRSEDPAAAAPDSKRGKMKKSRSAVFKDKLLAKIMPKRRGSKREKSGLPSKPAFESVGGGHRLRDPQDDRGHSCISETSARALMTAKSAPSLVNLEREMIVESRRRRKRSGGGGDGFVFAVILAALVVGGRGAALVGAVAWFAVVRWAGVRFENTSMYENSGRTLRPFVDA